MTDTEPHRPGRIRAGCRRGSSCPTPSEGFATVRGRAPAPQGAPGCGLRVLGRLRLAEGVAGHVTVRDPEHTDHFWVNPFGHNFKLMKVSDLILVSHTGEVVEGNRPVNAAAFAIHSELHKARPDVVAAAHCHSMYGKTFSTLGKPLKMISQDATMFYDDVVLHAEGGGAVVLDPAGRRRHGREPRARRRP